MAQVIYCLFIAIALGCAPKLSTQGHTEIAHEESRAGYTQGRSMVSVETAKADSIITISYIHDTIRTVQKIYKPASVINTHDTLFIKDTLYKTTDKFIHDTLTVKEESSKGFLNTYWWLIIILSGLAALKLRTVLA